MELTQPRVAAANPAPPVPLAGGPHAAPRTAVIWAVLRGELDRRAGQTVSVVDVGGGTGGFAVPLAEAGHQVMVVDASPDALAGLTRRAAEAGVSDRITAVQGDGDLLAGLVAPDSADLVLCHSLLEVVEDPAGVVRALAAALRPGGATSIVVANHAAAVLARATAGQLPAATALMAAPDGSDPRRDTAPTAPPAAPKPSAANPLRRRYDVPGAVALLSAAGLTVEQIHGVRVIADLVPGAVADADPEALLAFELAAAARPPYRDIATQLHLFARRPDG